MGCKFSEGNLTETNSNGNERVEEPQAVSVTNGAGAKSSAGHVAEKKRGRKRGWKKNKSDSNLVR